MRVDADRQPLFSARSVLRDLVAGLRADATITADRGDGLTVEVD
jgi:hypothetical protein